ncbi:MAG TPA: GNAT family N-acetyltransferase [Puia sp.]|nr:GNAT family N-acetyltransferase [Puia sp.]
MTLVPIHIDEDSSRDIYANPECQEIFQWYPSYYYKVGYNPPWIGYFVLRDGEPVGVAGFVKKPVEGRVEIAYGTFKKNEGQGIASFSCSALVEIARKTDPGLIIFAKTEPRKNASTTILEKNGFCYMKVVQDADIGDAWEWVLAKMDTNEK